MPNRLRNSYNLSIPRQFSRMTSIPKGWQTGEERERRFIASITKRSAQQKKDNRRNEERGHRY